MKKILLILAAALVFCGPVSEAKSKTPVYPSAEKGWKKAKPEKLHPT